MSKGDGTADRSGGLRLSSSIRGRLLLGFMAISLIGGLVGAFGLWAVTQAGDIVKDIYARPLMAINFARAASAGFAQMDRERLVLELRPADDPGPMHATLDRLTKTFFDDLAVAEQRALSDPAREAARAAREQARRWSDLRRERRGERADVAQADMKALSATIFETLETLIELTAGDSFLERQRAVDAIDDARWLVAAGLGLALALSALVTVFLGRRIVAPLNEAGKVADRIAAGEFYTPIPEARPDEIGVLLRSMHVMQDNIREMMLREQARSWSAQARLIAALESSPDGLLLVDAQGRLVIANTQVGAFFPEARDVLFEGTPFATVFGRIAPYHGAAPEQAANPDALAQQLARLGDGRWVRAGRAPTPDGGFFLLWTDVTELKEREARLEVAREQAQAANDAKSEFLATMGHELRTPLNAVIGFSEVLGGQLFGPLGNEKYQEYAGHITQAARGLLDVINNVLDLAKRESGRLMLQTEPVELPALLSDCAGSARADCAAAELGFDLVLPATPITVVGDPAKLRRVVLNLLSNAVKFSKPGGAVRMELSAEPDGSDAVITVSDTGIGMSAEQIPTALAAFGQVDSRLARRYEGTGLGLPLAKAFTELHGGRLEIDSALGRGTTVRVRLPRNGAAHMSAAAE